MSTDKSVWPSLVGKKVRMEEPFVTGMWFESNGHRWERISPGLWRPDETSLRSCCWFSDSQVRALGVSVHKPEQPVVMVKKIVSTQLCKHLMAGDTACLHLPKEFAGKEVRVILESAIANGEWDYNTIGNECRKLLGIEPVDKVLVIRGVVK